jgi:two-component system cell cycle sensor histidine kinase/response regulator CckA
MITPKPLRLLLLEDQEDDEILVLRELKRCGYAVTHTRVQTARDMRRELDSGTWDAIISDYSMPEFSAPTALEVLRESRVDLPFIICSGTIGEETAVSALRAGAHDFMLKSQLSRLGPAIEREMRDAAVRKAQRESNEEVKRLEEQVRQSQKMEAIGRLAGGVAHDFNNILTAILSTADLALEEPNLNEQLRKDLETIRESGNRGAAITRQLLTFSRKQVVQPEPLDLNAVVINMAPMLERLLRPGVTLELSAAGTGAIEADLTQIEQVLLNLVANANDAMPDGGVITVTTSDIDTYAAASNDGRVLPPGNYAVLRVRDTGMGMDEATAAHIFEPFFTTKDHGKGTGLGLATVYGIVNQARALIFVHTCVGEGATFEVCFPRIEAPAVVAGPIVAHAVEPDLRGNEVLLVVEDEPTVRAPICRTLRDLGYFVLEAKHGEDALAVLQEYHAPVHLVISDVMMPTMSGTELVGLLHEWYPNLKVLFVSGYSEEMVKAQGALTPETDYMPKPFTTGQLARRVRRLLDKTRPSRSGRWRAASMNEA